MVEMVVCFVNFSARMMVAALVLVLGCNGMATAVETLSTSEKQGADAMCAARVVALQFQASERAAALKRCAEKEHARIDARFAPLRF